MSGYTKSYDHVMKDSTVSLLARNIYCRLARFTENDRDAYPDQQWIGEEFGLTGEKGEQKVYRAIRELKKYGVITAHQRGKKQSNVYTVNAWPLECSIKIDDSRKARYAGYKSEPSNMMSHNESEPSNMMDGEPSNMMNIRDNSNIQPTTNKESFIEDKVEVVNESAPSTVSIESEEVNDESFSTVSPLTSVSSLNCRGSSQDYKSYVLPDEVEQRIRNAVDTIQSKGVRTGTNPYPSADAVGF